MTRRLLATLALAVPALGLLLGFPMFQGMVRQLPLPGVGARADAIAVLTGGPGRIEAGVQLLQDGAAPVLLVSGVGLRIGLDDIARIAGVAPESLAGRVSLGRAAASTRGNAIEIAAFAEARGARRILVVSADFHLPRALVELRRALPQAEFVPVPVRGAPVRTEAWLREYAKYLGAFAGLSRLFPAREEARSR
jgi:uncharacterized SAM-binding protein YcdF (DUF218 family)